MIERGYGHLEYRDDCITGFECHVCNLIHDMQEELRSGGERAISIADRSHWDCPLLYPVFGNPEDGELNNNKIIKLCDNIQQTHAL